ncbi:hypothetical protein TWF718_010282 [Orbilia javanica]|uniref:CFEM domain-containing protein n=1 Tax=Orbilia javanica TaxID=47235 RepID=A0AAN8MLQ1_9PEZI
MKAVFALAASLSLASAALLPRQLDQIPQCALSCALTSLQSSSGCSATDFACICRASSFVESLIPCVTSGCSDAEIQATIQAATELCSQAGVSLSVPPLAGETTAATSAPASTSAPAATTEATTSAPSTETTEAPTSAAETSAAETTEAPATTAAGNGTVTTTSPPSPTGTEPGAAGRNTVALGGLGAIVALVAAFL